MNNWTPISPCRHGKYAGIDHCVLCPLEKEQQELLDKIANLSMQFEKLTSECRGILHEATEKRIENEKLKYIEQENILERLAKLESEIDKNASPHFDHDDYREIISKIAKLENYFLYEEYDKEMRTENNLELRMERLEVFKESLVKTQHPRLLKERIDQLQSKLNLLEKIQTQEICNSYQFRLEKLESRQNPEQYNSEWNKLKPSVECPSCKCQFILPASNNK